MCAETDVRANAQRRRTAIGRRYTCSTQPTGRRPGSGLLTFLPIILLIAAMYFLMIRPQSKRRREAQEMQSRLAPGDEVQTVGGLYGTVVAVDDESVTLEAAPGRPRCATPAAPSRG